MTTEQAAKVLGVHRISLWRWIRAGKVPAPKHIIPRRRQAYWTPAEVERLRAARARNVRPPGNPGSLRKLVDARLVAKLRSQGLSWPRVADRIGAAACTLRKRFPRPQIPPGTISTGQVAAQLGCSRASLYQWIKRGLVPAPAKLSAAWPLLRWTPADIEAARVARKRIAKPGGRKPRKIVDVALIASLRRAGATWRHVAARARCCVPVARAAWLRISQRGSGGLS